MTIDERRKYLKRMAERYWRADRRGRGHLLTELHVVLDNLNTHRPKHASWLNHVGVWFSNLTRAVLCGSSDTDRRQGCAAIDRFTATRNEHPAGLPRPIALAIRHAGQAASVQERK